MYWDDAIEKRQPAAFDKDTNSTTSVDTPLGFAEQGGDIVGNSWLGRYLGLPRNASQEEITKEWDRRISSVCKPCWELKYCPYGPLVEQFPLPPLLREQARQHYEYVKQSLATGRLGDGRMITADLRKQFEQEVAAFREEDYPIELSQGEREASCSVFGHFCPVFFVNEPFTETGETRRIGRYIPFATKVRVARRDNYTCQICGRHLRDDEIEFDHIIPISKGGSSEEGNLRLTCRDCNRRKGQTVGFPKNRGRLAKGLSKQQPKD